MKQKSVNQLTNNNMKGTDNFKKTIQAYIENLGATDEQFIALQGRNIDDCITYILNQVKASGANGFTDDEIYGWAVHYWTEKEVTVGEPINMDCRVNHIVELTEEEKAEAKQKAIDEVIAVEKQRMQGGKTKGNITTPKPTVVTPTTAAPTLFDL